MPIDRLRRRGRHRVGARPGNAFAGALLFTLLGIFGMHGLGIHGIHGIHGADSINAAQPLHRLTEAPGTGVAASEQHDRSALLVEVGEQHDPSTLLVEVGCLAILLGLGFVLRILWRRRSTASPGGDRGRRAYPVFPARSRTRGPPTLAELSILRC